MPGSKFEKSIINSKQFSNKTAPRFQQLAFMLATRERVMDLSHVTGAREHVS